MRWCSLFTVYKMDAFFLVLVYALAPAGVLWLCKRFAWLDKIGPVLLLYLLGILLSNLGYRPSGMAQVQDILSSAMVPLAIPLMLFGCTFQKSETRSQLLALITGMAAVALMVVAGYFWLAKDLPQGAQIGAMLTGVYTGGTINLASLKTMLGVPEETFVLLNSYDMLISFLFLVFLLSVGIKLFRSFLPNLSHTSQDKIEVEKDAGNPYKGILSRKGLKDVGVQLGFSALIIGVSAALASLPGASFMTVFILALTTLSIGASFLKALKGRKYGYHLGMYCIYIFSMVVASMVDLKAFDFHSGLYLLLYLVLVIFGSLLLQSLLAKIFKIDADTMVISSVAFICSPPFVPMMAAAMRNKNVLAAGLAIGVVGYAAGNYLGYLMFKLLACF